MKRTLCVFEVSSVPWPFSYKGRRTGFAIGASLESRALTKTRSGTPLAVSSTRGGITFGNQTSLAVRAVRHIYAFGPSSLKLRCSQQEYKPTAPKNPFGEGPSNVVRHVGPSHMVASSRVCG